LQTKDEQLKIRLIKTQIRSLVLVLFLIPSLLQAFEGKVVGISDGDTIKVLKNGKQVKIRLAAIDCPEKKQPYGRKPNSSPQIWLPVRLSMSGKLILTGTGVLSALSLSETRT